MTGTGKLCEGVDWVTMEMGVRKVWVVPGMKGATKLGVGGQNDTVDREDVGREVTGATGVVRGDGGEVKKEKKQKKAK